ncbi:MAG: hypothetical protein ABI851_14820, partial [Saprospiraceae bacterium]
MKIKNNIKIFFFFIVIVVFHSCVTDRSNADNTFDVSVAEPKLSALRPKVLFDESHKEHHQIERTYKPLADLITNDGCIVNSNLRPIDKISLSKTDIYAIVTAMGKEDPGAISPFTTNEINSLENWVSNGGSLLLVTEHYPFGLAMKPLLNKFGIDVHNGYTEDTLLNATDVKDALLFEKSNRNLNATHPICQNVERVYTFTGASIKGDS